MQTKLPKHGQKIIFKVVPPASYCSAETEYVVDRPGERGAFRFVNAARGSSTYDPAWAVNRSEWAPA